MYSHVQVGDEILAVNLVDVTHMSLDDVVIIMSIPRRLVLATRHGPHQPVSHSRQSEHKAPPVVVIKRELNEDESDHATSNHVRYYTARSQFLSRRYRLRTARHLANWLFRTKWITVNVFIDFFRIFVFCLFRSVTNHKLLPSGDLNRYFANRL